MCRLAAAHLQLVVVRLAAAVRLLGRGLVGVEQEADAAVISHLHVLHSWTNQHGKRWNSSGTAAEEADSHQWGCRGRRGATAKLPNWASHLQEAELQSVRSDWWPSPCLRPAAVSPADQRSRDL